MSDRHGTGIGAITFVYYFHVRVSGYLSIQWDASMQIRDVPDFSNAFVHFAMTSEVPHFPDPSDVPVLRRIVSRRVSIKMPTAQTAGHPEAPPTSSEPIQEQRNAKISILTSQLISVAPSCARTFGKMHHIKILSAQLSPA